MNKLKYSLIILGLMATALTCRAVDYSLHMSDARVYRVALGSGTAPDADDMQTIGVRPGDMVVNTDDDALYIMSATNKYTKITAAGVTTLNTLASPTISGAMTLDGASTIAGTSTNSTSRAAVFVTPLASTTRAGVSRESLVTIGDITGTTPFGFGVTNHSTYGLMACFGRTAVATSDWDGNYDTALDARCLNKFTNNAAYNLRGGYIKVKNYAGGVVGQMDGLTIEAVADGTEAEVAVLKLGSDTSSVEYGIDMREIGTAATADIVLSEGATIRNTSSTLLTITETTVDVVGAVTADSFSARNGWNGIITNASTLITNKITVVGGIITTNIATLP